MTFILRTGKGLKGTFPSSGDDLLIPIDVDPEQYFSLKIRSKGSFPLVSIETTSGQTVLEPSSFNRNTAQTPLLDPQLLELDSLVARVSTQGGQAGKFRLKLSRLGDLDDIRDDVIRFTNKQRRKHNLDPLSGDALLHQAAQGHVDDMDATGRYLGHDSSDGRSVRERIDASGYQWRSIRENVASGQRSARAVVKGWMNSPGHRANILSDDVSEIGIGFAVDDQSGATYWTQKFAAPG